MRMIVVSLMALVIASNSADGAEVVTRECDLLVVGGGESGVAAAVQAARLGVPRIVLVNDCHWLGGQFTAEGLGAVDEWTKYRDGRAPFPRSGLFLEIMQMIEDDMQRKYGTPRPGNCFCAWTTCEPRDTELLFRKLVEPYLRKNGGPLEIVERMEPTQVVLERRAVACVEFVEVGGGETASKLLVRAGMTIDASDWGDVVRLSGAKFYCGPDLKQRFDEPSAPESFAEVGRNEINPITYNLVLRESAKPMIVPKPKHYDERRYFAATIATRAEFQGLGWPAAAMKPFAAAWRDTNLPKGPYSESPTVYHHRRLVDRRHLSLPAGSERVLVNWPLQDYPTDRYPQHVVDALEEAESGASQMNLAEMSPRLRRIVFEDAKLHALGLLHHLQTTVAERDLAAAGGKPIVTFRDLELTDEFGTPDRLPLKPYLREALRTECLTMLREQNVRDTDGVQCWAAKMATDGVFGFQFNIDFHPTRRIFLNDDPKKTWTLVHTKHRNWSTDTDRSMMPLGSLIPREIDGLIVAGKSLGVSSIVQSAVRLHGHGMLAGQAAGTLAFQARAGKFKPRELAQDPELVQQVQLALLKPMDVVTKRSPPGVILWPYQDVTPRDPWFVAANVTAVRGIYRTDDGVPDFSPKRPVTDVEVQGATAKANVKLTTRPQTRGELVLALFAALGDAEASAK
ncbi:MAG: hypothetical protein C0483_05835 [Pirellula sp.]|nr:hypothetical protein [Pirellula sp.]